MDINYSPGDLGRYRCCLWFDNSVIFSQRCVQQMLKEGFIYPHPPPVAALGHHLVKQWPIACSAPGHHLNQWRLFILFGTRPLSWSMKTYHSVRHQAIILTNDNFSFSLTHPKKRTSTQTISELSNLHCRILICTFATIFPRGYELTSVKWILHCVEQWHWHSTSKRIFYGRANQLPCDYLI